jgi:uncharacterized membrane protein
MAHIFTLPEAIDILFMALIRTNVGDSERLLSVAAGALLLFNAIIRKHVSILQTSAATYLLLRGLTGYCLAYQGLGKKGVDFRPKNINIKTAIMVNRPRHEVYAFWRRLENLPLFMKHLESVKVIDEKISEWKADIPGPLGTLTWQSEIVKDDPGSLLSWRSLPGSSIENAGKIKFRDSGKHCTEIHAVITYQAPLGIVGEKAIRVFNPIFENMVKQDIANFKWHIESGEPAKLEQK